MPAEVWGERWSGNDSSMARRWMDACVAKRSLVILAADRPKMAGLYDILEGVHRHVVALKTHVDLVQDWTRDGWAEFCNRVIDKGMMIFEDRKFADIGKISLAQMGGVYDIQNWADLVTAHLISGPDIVDGLQAAWTDVNRKGGVLLLAQMSSRGNLLHSAYTDAVVSTGLSHPGVFGFIGNGSNSEELRELRKKVGSDKMIWTPGVNFSNEDGEMGQRYGDPYEAVMAGSDGIIIGSGIHQADSPPVAARAYAEASWQALLDRR